jgi:hypothetical protein
MFFLIPFCNILKEISSEKETKFISEIELPYCSVFSMWVINMNGNLLY